MRNIDFLLKQVNILRMKVEARRESEDEFNVFSVLLNENDEVNLHSRFISVMLDHHSPHKKGTTFLNLLLPIIESKFKYTTSDLLISPNYENSIEYRDIDIYIRTAKAAIIIENKIGAGDSNHPEEGQLEKYYREAIEDGINKDEIEVYYLTLDGHEPSEESVNTSKAYPELKGKVRCITYGNEILSWIRECAKESFDKPMLRESINQYIKLIQRMTNNESTIEEIKALLDLIGKNDDNLYSTKFILENYKHLQWHSIYNFWKELSEAIEERDGVITSRIENETIDDLVHGGPQKRKQDLNLYFSTSNKIPIGINCDYGGRICFGLAEPSNKFGLQIKNAAKELQQTIPGDGEPNGNWLYWRYFNFDGSNISFSNFDCEDTFRIISQTHRKAIIEKIINEIIKFESSVINLIKQ